MKIEWDPQKAKLNLKKHGVAFEEDATALIDPMTVTVSNERVNDYVDRICACLNPRLESGPST